MYVRDKMIAKAIMIELGQSDYWSPRNIKIVKKSMSKVNGEMLFCDFTKSNIILSREGDMQNFA